MTLAMEYARMETVTRILLLEDDEMLARALQCALADEGYSVSAARTVAEAHRRQQAEPPDLLLLDLSLPDGDGLDYLSAVRANGAAIPAIVITARSSLDERIDGFRTGADDYMIKPFAIAELMARIAAVLRRAVAAKTIFRIDDLCIDVSSRQVERNGHVLTLTPREFDILAHLARAEGRPVSRDTLGREQWKIRSRSTSMDNVIDVGMSRLRQKLEIAGRPSLLQTIRGLGYRLGLPL